MNPQKLKAFAERDNKKSPKAKFGKGADQGGGDQHDEGDDADEADHEHDAEGADKGEGSDEELAAKVGAQVSSGHTDDGLMEHLKDYDPEVDGNPPSWITDEATWERAKKAVEPNWDEYDEPYAVVAHVYKEMGGETK